MKNKFYCLAIIFTVFWTNAVQATSVEDYVKVCVSNQKNQMGPGLCECVANKAKGRFNANEFGYFYAIAAKDGASINKYNSQLKQQEKMNVIMFSMKGPAECANDPAHRNKRPESPVSGGDESAAAGAASAAMPAK